MRAVKAEVKDRGYTTPGCGDRGGCGRESLCHQFEPTPPNKASEWQIRRSLNLLLFHLCELEKHATYLMPPVSGASAGARGIGRCPRHRQVPEASAGGRGREPSGIQVESQPSGIQAESQVGYK